MDVLGGARLLHLPSQHLRRRENRMRVRLTASCPKSSRASKARKLFPLLSFQNLRPPLSCICRVSLRSLHVALASSFRIPRLWAPLCGLTGALMSRRGKWGTLSKSVNLSQEARKLRVFAHVCFFSCVALELGLQGTHFHVHACS